MMRVDDTLELIKVAHAGQVDKQGMPYEMHPVRVATYARQIMGRDYRPEIIHAALLHDVLEDTPMTVDQLLVTGYEPEVVEAVVILTRTKEESYSDYISRVAESRNKIAITVKLADLMDNTAVDRPIPKRLYRRYTLAMIALQPVLEELR